MDMSFKAALDTCICDQMSGQCSIGENNLLAATHSESEFDCFLQCSAIEQCKYYTWFSLGQIFLWIWLLILWVLTQSETIITFTTEFTLANLFKNDASLNWIHMKFCSCLRIFNERKLSFTESAQIKTAPECIENSHYGNGVPAMFIS